MIHPVLLASFWMLLALTGFSLLAIAAREASEQLSVFQLLLFRSLISLLVISFILQLKGWQRLHWSHHRLHITRNLAHYLGQLGWLVGIVYLPLAEVFALEFTTPIWAAMLASLLLAERFNRYKLLALLLGLSGVALILKPGIEVIQPAAFAVLLGALSYALSHTLTRKLALQTGLLTILFFMSLIQLVVSLPVLVFDPIWPGGLSWFWVVLVALLGLFAHFAMGKALSYADVMVVIPIDFLRLPLISLLAWWIYSETIDGWLIAGAGLMLAGNMISVLHSSRRRNN